MPTDSRKTIGLFYYSTEHVPARFSSRRCWLRNVGPSGSIACSRIRLPTTWALARLVPQAPAARIRRRPAGPGAFCIDRTKVFPQFASGRWVIRQPRQLTPAAAGGGSPAAARWQPGYRGDAPPELLAGGLDVLQPPSVCFQAMSASTSANTMVRCSVAGSIALS